MFPIIPLEKRRIGTPKKAFKKDRKPSNKALQSVPVLAKKNNQFFYPFRKGTGAIIFPLKRNNMTLIVIAHISIFHIIPIVGKG